MQIKRLQKKKQERDVRKKLHLFDTVNGKEYNL